MKHTSLSRSGLFLMEMIFAILFFSIGCAVCVQLFVRSYNMSTDSRNLNHAVTCAQSVAEAVKGTHAPPEELKAYFPDSEASGDTLQVFYNNNWLTCARSLAVYQMDVVIQTDSPFLATQITVWEISDPEAEPIYSLQTQVYLTHSVFPKAGRDSS